MGKKNKNKIMRNITIDWGTSINTKIKNKISNTNQIKWKFKGKKQITEIKLCFVNGSNTY
jgi:hypothetical protein